MGRAIKKITLTVFFCRLPSVHVQAGIITSYTDWAGWEDWINKVSKILYPDWSHFSFIAFEMLCSQSTGILLQVANV